MITMDPTVNRPPTGRLPKLPLLAPIGVVAFTVTWAVLGAISPGYQMWDIVVPSYSPLAQPVSGLGLGETAVWMNTAFVVCGLLVTTGAWTGTRPWSKERSPRLRRVARVLVSVSGVGMALCGLFTLESIMIHSLGFLLAVGAPAVGFIAASFVARRTDRGFSRYLLCAGPIALALLALFLTSFDPLAAGENEGVAGLVQRTLILLVLGTIAVIGVRAATGRSESVSPPAAGGSRALDGRGAGR